MTAAKKPAAAKPKSEIEPFCPVCGNRERIIKKGVRDRKTGKEAQRYECKVCGYKFTQERMKQAFYGPLHMTGRTTVYIDKERDAKMPGKRTVTQDNNKRHKALGLPDSFYTEFRRNRADVDKKFRL